ncbi:hypothetical protein UFOVP591_39 [uncultured Caudovirales phage]|uniref:Uncharacterized protein n=1 Tax=uncultured Caudovirales phage TaxID=2100421 RepID=A0A6J5MX34_9CAUD|nr:hypothetical protein UFOVP591_39 [uncultured Caudovirales phage]
MVVKYVNHKGRLYRKEGGKFYDVTDTPIAKRYDDSGYGYKLLALYTMLILTLCAVAITVIKKSAEPEKRTMNTVKMEQSWTW